MKDKILSLAPYLLFFLLTLIFFYQTFFLRRIPLPADLIVGGYYPWLDYKWGSEVGVAVKNPLLSDVVSVLYPIKVYAVNLIKSGQLPLWNSKMFGGYPLLANFQLGLFFPTMFFYFIMPSIWAWTLQVVSQPLLACIFMYIFLRNLNLSKFSAIFGSIAYGFGGYMMIWLEWNALGLTAAFLPLLLFTTDKLLQSKSKKWGVILSFAIALQIFAGYPQVAIYSFIAVGLRFLFKVFSIQNLLIVGFFFILGIAITSILLFPGFELFLNSQRRDEILGLDLAFLPYQNLIAFFAPDYFGNPATYNFWGMGNYTYISIYSGLITIFLAIFSIFSKYKEKMVLFFILLLVLSLLIILENPLSLWLYSNGFWGGSASSTIRAAFLVNFSLAALAAITLDRIDENFKKFTKFILISATLVFIIFILTFGVKQLLVSNSINLNISIRNLLFPTFLSATILIMTIFFFRIKVYKYILLLILIAELFKFGWKFNTFSEVKFLFPETPVTNFLESKKEERIVGIETIPANMWIPYGLSSAGGFDAVYPKNIATYIAVLNSSDINSSSTRYGLLENPDSQLFDLTSSKYLVVLKKKGDKVAKEGDIRESFKSNKYKKVFEDGSVVVLENVKSVPRAYAVKKTIYAKGRDILKMLLDKNVDIDNTAILESKNLEIRGEGIRTTLELSEISSGHFQVRGKIPRDSVVVLTNTFYPGWKAYLNGKTQDIYPINYTFMGIKINKNTDQIDLLYDPKSLKIGTTISLVSILIALLIAGIPGRIIGIIKNK